MTTVAEALRQARAQGLDRSDAMALLGALLACSRTWLLTHDDAPLDEQWPRVAPDPRAHIYLEAKLRLDRAVAVAWVTDRAGRRVWSHYGRMPLALDRDGWVRTAVALGAEPAGSIVRKSMSRRSGSAAAPGSTGMSRAAASASACASAG